MTRMSTLVYDLIYWNSCTYPAVLCRQGHPWCPLEGHLLCLQLECSCTVMSTDLLESLNVSQILWEEDFWHHTADSQAQERCLTSKSSFALKLLVCFKGTKLMSVGRRASYVKGPCSMHKWEVWEYQARLPPSNGENLWLNSHNLYSLRIVFSDLTHIERAYLECG